MAHTLERELTDARYRVSALLERLVKLGHLGRKTKRGIFDYSGETPSINPAVL